MLLLLLSLSVVSLAAGPLLLFYGRRLRRAEPWTSGLLMGLVPALIVVRSAMELSEGSVLPVLLCAGGYVLVWLTGGGHEHREDQLGHAVVMPALAIHALGDGTALLLATAMPGPSGWLLGLAVVFHRFPEGLIVAARFYPSLGLWGTALRLGALALATILGATLAAFIAKRLPEAALDGLLMFGLGAMARLVLRKQCAHAPAPAGAVASGSVLGLLAGLFAFWLGHRK